MKLGGIDACKAGWAVTLYQNDKFSFGIYDKFETLIRENPDLNRILIDIPIGLSSMKFNRTIEKEMRKELKGRESTIFNVPSRDSVYEEDYEIAKTLNLETQHISLSKQSFGISKKIKEIDTYLIANKDSKIELLEAHPEMCFKYLNRGKVVKSSKKSYLGIKKRLKILKKHDKSLKKYAQSLLKSYTLNSKNKIQEDDILDSLCLCLTNVLGHQNPKNFKFLKDENLKDGKGIEVKIAYYKA